MTHSEISKYHVGVVEQPVMAQLQENFKNKSTLEYLAQVRAAVPVRVNLPKTHNTSLFWKKGLMDIQEIRPFFGTP